jgi:uncharacterized protein YutE (UPF0331/DUF86 family)
MSSVDRELIVRKFQIIDENIQVLKEVSSTSAREAVLDPIKRAATERLLQVAIEAAIDIGCHIISALKLKAPSTYAEIAEILAGKRIISAGTQQKISKMIRFRNLLVHGYAKVDPERLAELLEKNLDDFNTFKQEISEWLKRGEK